MRPNFFSFIFKRVPKEFTARYCTPCRHGNACSKRSNVFSELNSSNRICGTALTAAYIFLFIVKNPYRTLHIWNKGPSDAQACLRCLYNRRDLFFLAPRQIINNKLKSVDFNLFSFVSEREEQRPRQVKPNTQSDTEADETDVNSEASN